jgi:hypothetical protein
MSSLLKMGSRYIHERCSVIHWSRISDTCSKGMRWGRSQGGGTAAREPRCMRSVACVQPRGRGDPGAGMGSERQDARHWHDA